MKSDDYSGTRKGRRQVKIKEKDTKLYHIISLNSVLSTVNEL